MGEFGRNGNNGRDGRIIVCWGSRFRGIAGVAYLYGGDGTYVINVTDDGICEWAALRMKKGRFARCGAAFYSRLYCFIISYI